MRNNRSDMPYQFTVFISHVSEDESIAVALKRFIETVFLNADVFVAGKDLAGGDLWVKEIRDQLRIARVIIAVITPFSRETPWVLFEAGAGFVDSRTIPVCADGITPEALDVPLKLLQARDMSAAGLQKLAADIARRAELREPETLPGLKDAVTAIDEFVRTRRESLTTPARSPAERKPPVVPATNRANKKQDPELQSAYARVTQRIKDAARASIELARGTYDVPSTEELAKMAYSELNDVAECFNIPQPNNAHLTLMTVGFDFPSESDSRWKRMNKRRSIEEADKDVDKFLREISKRRDGAEPLR